MNPTLETPVGELAAAHPLTTRVFARHGIDFCCGGGRPLAEACRARDLDPTGILDEIRRELAGPADPGKVWTEAPLSELIDHILEAYHRPLHEELPRLVGMANKVHSVHGEKDPERLGELARLVGALSTELHEHMAKEERILFPAILAGRSVGLDGPMGVMRMEHDHAGEALGRIRELTGDYRVPAEACNTWRALWHGLADLERSLMEHIHLENNVLFPRLEAASV